MRHYDAMGQAMDEMARQRGARGPSAIARRMQEVSGRPTRGVEVAAFLAGEDREGSEFNIAFSTTFRLTEEEQDRLAYLYTFGEEPPDEFRGGPR